jgi:hypothetical protein
MFKDQNIKTNQPSISKPLMNLLHKKIDEISPEQIAMNRL